MTDLPAAATEAPIAVALPVGSLRPNKWNRKRYNVAAFKNLVGSVLTHGVIQPIIARPVPHAEGQPSHEIVAGERRWRAAQEAGLATLPATVRSMTDLELIELLLVENTEREEMNALDEAQCLHDMLRQPGQLQGYASPEELAARIGRSRAYVYQRLKLLTLCEEAQQALRDGAITANHALRLSRLPNPADQAEALKACLRGWGGNPMSVRDLEEHLHRTYMLDLAHAPFPIKSATLLPAAGSCTECPKRSGNAPDLFEDVKKGDTCTDGTCYQAKAEAHRQALKDQAEAEGKKVISGAAAKKVKPQQYGNLKGYLELDKVHYEIGSKPLRKLLGKHPLEVQLLEDPHGGDLVHVVEEEAALKLLKERGVIKASRMPTSNASEREAAAKAKAETAWRGAVAEACVAAAGGTTLQPEFSARLVWLVAQLLWREMQHDTCERVTKLLGWPPLPRSWQSGTGKTIAEHFEALSGEQLRQYFVAAAIAGEVHAGVHSAGNKPERLLAMAQQLGVDAAGIKEQLRAQARQRVQGKASKDREAKAKGQPAQTPETALAGALKKAAKGKPAPKAHVSDKAADVMAA